MRIIAWSTAYWNDKPAADRLKDGVLGLDAWYERVTHLFRPFHTFLACGTWSEPEFSPLPKEVSIINAGIEPGEPYDLWYRQYCCAAFSAACAYLLNRKDWDLSVMLNYDALVGAVNFNALLQEFIQRKESLLTEAWCGCPGGSMVVWKREACCDFLHSRLQGNIIKQRTNVKPMIGEYEMKQILHWWNPWPNGNAPSKSQGSRQGYAQPDDLELSRCMSWPFISQPHPIVVPRYLAEQYTKAVPV